MKCIINRSLSVKLKELVTEFPMIFLSGPRQSGKTTLLKGLSLKNCEYISLEETHARDFARCDPKGFLNTFKGRVIIDDVHHAPALVPHMKEKIDEKGIQGLYVLSGRLDSDMSKSISRYLHGRAVKLSLLPFSISEMERAGRQPKTSNEWMFRGAYPELFSSAVDPQDFFHGYITNLVEQDIKSELTIYGLNKFRRFLAILAEKSGDLINLSKLGKGASVDARTANSWINILEEQYILFRLPPYHGFEGRRYAKTPKLYFFDAGFLCFLLGIKSAEELNFHPMRSKIFETAVISEIIKKCFNAGRRRQMYFWRDLDSRKKGIDLIEERPHGLELTEINLSQTANEEYARRLINYPLFPESILKAKTIKKRVIYDGDASPVFENVQYFNWKLL